MFDGLAKREKERERRTNSRSQARVAICLMGEEEQTTNKQQNRTNDNVSCWSSRAMVNLQEPGKLEENDEQTKQKEQTDERKRATRREREERRDIDEPILRCSEGGVRAQGQSTFATRHSFPL